MRRTDRWSVAPLAIVALSAIAATFAGGKPTAVPAVDLALLAATAGALAFAAGFAPRWALFVVSGVAAAMSDFDLWGACGWAALLGAVALTARDARSRIIATGIGALAVQSLLRLPGSGFFGLPSLLVTAAALIFLGAAYRHAPRRHRSTARRLALGLAIAAVAAVALGTIPLIDARATINAGLDAADRAVAAARNGDTAAASTQMVRAEGALSSAADKVNSPLTLGLRYLPVAAQHHNAIRHATEIGAAVATESSAMVEDLRLLDNSVASGAPDLELIQSLAPRLERTARTLSDARSSLIRIDSPWLIPQVGNRLDSFVADIDELLPEVELAAEATAVLPGMLGADAPRQYLVFFATPAESRELGGFVGSWATIAVEQGSIRLIDSGRKTDLYPIASESRLDPAESLPWFLDMARPVEFPENLTGASDPRFVADMTQRVLGSGSELGFDIDGIIYIDAVAIIDLLQLTGPVTLGDGSVLTRENAGDFFFRDQYQIVSGERTELFESLSEVAAQVLEQLTTVALPGPEALGAQLGPAARGGHLQIVTFDERENEFLESVKLLRDFADRSLTDMVALVQSNGLANKMDLYLSRSLDYDISLGDDGLLNATATATLRSSPPPDAPAYTLGPEPTTGINRIWLSLYSPHVLTDVQLNGASVPWRQTEEFGLNRYLVQVDLPPTNEPYELVYDLVGRLSGQAYSLGVWRQALINVDTVSVTYRGQDGQIDWSGPLAENMTFVPEQVG